ncbi:MAG: hypothetical protein WBQ23_16960 [Bacteroidota bacterium]
MRNMNYPIILIVICLPLLIGCGGSKETQDAAPARMSSSGAAATNAAALNSDSDEFAPAMLPDGQTVLVTSNRAHGERNLLRSPEFLYGEAVYAVTRPSVDPLLQLDRGDHWSAISLFHPTQLERVNTGAVVLDPSTRQLYLSGTYRGNGDGGAEIYSMPWPITEGSEAQPVIAVNSPWWDAQPAISPDGSTMVFASDRVPAQPTVSDTGRRAPHLWIARRTDGGVWSVPEAMPAPINTGTAEMSPHFGSDGKLYFATRRWPEAGFEIVSSRFDGSGWSQPERLNAPFNSPSDDVFPFLTADRLQMLFASNRPGGAGGYDIWFAEMKYCVPLQVLVRLTDAAGSDAGAEPGAHIGLEVIETSTGKVVAKEVTDAEGLVDLQCLNVGRKYAVRPASKSCFMNSDGVEITTPMPDNIGEGVSVRIDLQRLALPEFYVVSDSIPFFVTGYWYPNTTPELARLRKRLDDDNDIPNANFIMTDDYPDYDGAAVRVDAWFNKLYTEIDRMLVPMLDSCYGAADTLIIFVQGYVDQRGLAWGKFDEPDVVRTLDAVINPGTIMQKQEGNEKLSHLRAWYAMRMIDQQMDTRSPRYKLLRAQNRIRLQSNGGSVGYGESGSTGGPVNDPLKRKFTVSVEIRSASGR